MLRFELLNFCAWATKQCRVLVLRLSLVLYAQAATARRAKVEEFEEKLRAQGAQRRADQYAKQQE